MSQADDLLVQMAAKDPWPRCALRSQQEDLGDSVKAGEVYKGLVILGYVHEESSNRD